MRVLNALMLGVAVILPATFATTGQAQSGRAQAAAAADWPRYARDNSGTRFSPLTQITPQNVAKLTTAWSLQIAPKGGGAIASSATPIVVGGVMYYPTGSAVLALEPETGKEI